MNIPDYSRYSLRELYEALDGIQGERYPENLKALEAEIGSRKEASRAELEEMYFLVDRKRYPEHARHLQERVEALGGFDTIRPEQVTDENRYHTGWRRFWALFFDGIVLQILTAIVSAVSVQLTGGGLAASAAGNFLSQYLSFFYFIIMHAALGQTVGKMITGVKVVRAADLGPIRLWHALARDAVPLALALGSTLALPHLDIVIGEGKQAELQLPPVVFVLAVASLLWGVIELLTMLFNKRRRALHDFIARTVVVRYLRPRKVKPQPQEPTVAPADSRVS